MLRINSNWPKGIQRFWRSIGRIKELGENSGFYPEEGRLEIHRCFNVQLDRNILDEKEYIKILIIRKNELDESSYKIISQLTNLEKLVLESVGSYIMDIDVNNLDKLTDVSIGSALNTELPQWIFLIKNLQSLSISNTRLEKFPDCSRYNGYKKWKKLDISYNAIESLPDFGNEKLNHLQVLRVAHTGIDNIPSCYITKTLKILDCSSTQIKSLEKMKEAENLEILRCSDNDYINILSGVPIDKLRVLDVSYCMNLNNLPNENDYNMLEVLSVCGNYFESLPLNLIEHCINKNILFKQNSVKRWDILDCGTGSLTKIPEKMKGVYIEETFIKQMDFRYLIDNDTKFLRYYIQNEREGKLQPKHEIKIMILGNEQSLTDLFLQCLFPDYPQIYYMNYGGLKVLDTAGGELDYVLAQLDYNTDISIWTIEDGETVQYMHRILFNEFDFFIIVLNEKDGLTNQKKAVSWLRKIEQCVQYATIGFVMIGEKESTPVVLSLNEVQQECGKQYFRFLNDVCYVNANKINIYEKLTKWLVKGIKEKSNYEMKILPDWKKLRVEITSYLNLRRVINKERFESLLPYNEHEDYVQHAFENYLTESKSLLRIEYLENEDYYFKTEWVISAVFALLDVLGKGELKNPFNIDDLRRYLQTEGIDYLDYFQDSKSMRYLMNILGDIGAICEYCNKYYGLIDLPYMEAESAIYEEIQTSALVKYQATYPILTDAMSTKIISILIKVWLKDYSNMDTISMFKGCIVFKIIDKEQYKGSIIVKIITGYPGKLLFYVLEPKKSKRVAARVLKERIDIFLNELKDLRNFPLWTVEIALYHMVNGISGFIPISEIENYAKSGYASVFMSQYNTLVDIDEIYNTF